MSVALMLLPTVPAMVPSPQGWSRREWTRKDRDGQRTTYIFVFNLCGSLKWVAQVAGTRTSRMCISSGEYELFYRIPGFKL